MKHILFIMAAAFAVCTLNSCDSNDEELLVENVPTEVRTRFAGLYNTTPTNWETDGQYYKVEFIKNGMKCEAWFTRAGEWVRTETDYTGTLPTPVQNYISANYQGYYVDDVELVETPSDAYFDIDLDHPTLSDVDLLIRADGSLLQGTNNNNPNTNNNNPNTDNNKSQNGGVPDAVVKAFESLYAGITPKWEIEHSMYKAEFYYNGKEYDALFKQDGTWVETVSDYTGTLPTSVQNYISANYQGYYVDDVEWVETPTGNYFEIDLEHHNKADIKLQITDDGTFLNSQYD